MKKKVSILESNSSNNRVVVGRIGRPHGLDGFVTITNLSDNPNRFRPGQQLWVGDQTLEIAQVRQPKRGLQIRFCGLEQRTMVEPLVGQLLEITETDRRELDSDEFWPDQLQGLEVRTVDGSVVGKVVGLIESDAQDRLVLQIGDEQIELPFVEELVPTVDIENGFLVISPPTGWLPSAGWPIPDSI